LIQFRNASRSSCFTVKLSETPAAMAFSTRHKLVSTSMAALARAT
jgi:hypothetical protein